MTDAPHIVIISAGFYAEIAQKLQSGAVAALERAGATYELVEVPGALEIPVALSLAINHGHIPKREGHGIYDGVVALGCVIRGETYHFEIVAEESSRGLMQLAINHHVPLGNGILTVESEAQALARLTSDNHKGEYAAHACLNLIRHENTFKQRKSSAPEC